MTNPEPKAAEEGAVGIRWGKINVPDRPDIIGVRSLENGQEELLMHNKALCWPYYTATVISVREKEGL